MSSCAHLSDTPDVLLSVLGREAKVLVQAEADVVAIESVGLETKVEEVLLESNGDGGLAGGRETSEPDGGTLLLAEVGALLTGEAGVPCDVAVALCQDLFGNVLSSRCKGRWRGRGGARSDETKMLWCGQIKRTHVAIAACSVGLVDI